MAHIEASSSDILSQQDEHLISSTKTTAANQSSNVLQSPESFHTQPATNSTMPKATGRYTIDPRSSISNLLKDKEREWTAVVQKNGPLQLLDLPMDVLKEIVKEITHTNDLTSLALTHSALHNLAIPHIYSRFDIVWPDAHATSDPRTGVDALTYGLATLCMGDLAHPRSREHPQQYACMNCGTINSTQCEHVSEQVHPVSQRRINNQYPQFTRKFSLGNGPPDWVQEYLITKESGKMLGTLVALAVGRMINLETFIWDMPTGVLRDVWLALSSLQAKNRTNSGCRLERVWVRWHDNSESSGMMTSQSVGVPSNTSPQMLSGSDLTSIGWHIPAGSVTSSQHLPRKITYAQSRVEYPTISVLPALKSLSVLDIDELDYLDEMSVSIAKSKEVLRELRVGISAKAINRDFAIPWDGLDLHQVDHNASRPGASTIGERRLGGVLGVLVGRIHDIRRKPKPKPEKRDINTSVATSTPIPAETTSAVSPMSSLDETITSASPNEERRSGTTINEILDSTTSSIPPIMGGLGLNPHDNTIPQDSSQSDVESLTALMSAYAVETDAADVDVPLPAPVPTQPLRRSRPHSQTLSNFSEYTSIERQKLEGKLNLHVLELERVSLSIAVLQKAINWSILTDLTILDCPQHHRLWSMLKRQFQPSPLTGHNSSKHHSVPEVKYHLNLKKIHTDAASPALISFLRETLAPNSLESLFLQDRRRSPDKRITINSIFKGPIKRHRASLKKLMLDSSDRIPRGPASSSDNSRWRAWMPNREILNFITSGRMCNLRELSMAIDYKDWHHFLQRLRQIPHLRSVNIPFLADHVTPAFDPKDLALQVVDVIVLCPEIELCYIGISHKCFEILENKHHEDLNGLGSSVSNFDDNSTADPASDEEDEEDEDGSDDEDDDDDDDDDEDDGTIAPNNIDPDETESEMSDHDDSDTDSFVSSDEVAKIRLRLREILVYDDKVAIFKARHGKL